MKTQTKTLISLTACLLFPFSASAYKDITVCNYSDTENGVKVTLIGPLGGETFDFVDINGTNLSGTPKVSFKSKQQNLKLFKECEVEDLRSYTQRISFSIRPKKGLNIYMTENFSCKEVYACE